MAIIVFGFAATRETSSILYIVHYILFFGDSDDLREEGCELVTDWNFDFYLRCHPCLKPLLSLL